MQLEFCSFIFILIVIAIYKIFEFIKKKKEYTKFLKEHNLSYSDFVRQKEIEENVNAYNKATEEVNKRWEELNLTQRES